MKVGKKDQSVDKIIENNIKVFRDIHGISRKDLASRFHISDDALYRIEKGQTGLSGEYAYILSDEFGCDMNFIYGKADVFEFILDSMKKAMESSDKENIKQMASRMLRYAARLIDEMSDEQA